MPPKRRHDTSDAESRAPKQPKYPYENRITEPVARHMASSSGRRRGQSGAAQQPLPSSSTATRKGHGQSKNQPADGLGMSPPGPAQNTVPHSTCCFPQPLTAHDNQSGGQAFPFPSAGQAQVRREPAVPTSAPPVQHLPPQHSGGPSGQSVVSGAATAQTQGQPGTRLVIHRDAFATTVSKHLSVCFTIIASNPGQPSPQPSASNGRISPNSAVLEKLPGGSRAYPCYRCLLHYMANGSDSTGSLQLCVDADDARDLAQFVIGIPLRGEISPDVIKASRTRLKNICQQMIQADQEIKASFDKYLSIWMGNSIVPQESLSTIPSTVSSAIRTLVNVLETLRAEQRAQGDRFRNLENRMEQLGSNPSRNTKQGDRVEKEG
ncbi:hypothetical protein SAPIO_CDS5335 [Scedosporium apiospermum]|uniref:Uncharacterized protein n=1 Tax=Pseudallescheria apiosperma TaxID=563466 RepID=A0A084G6D7_PSEDA|nr:uncharacterized protein SAPIO_CDS5335 [Scedosporium apiospermum]KEZ42899.1 hypothetical protein SAPIO_CDS5335 [Scedosporium apiospermum]